jgi:hypothetical protein
MPAAYTSMLSVQVSDFGDNCLLIQHDRLICDSCSSGQRFACSFLQIIPRDITLAVRLTLPPVGCVEDFHLLVGAPCRAHKKKRLPGQAALNKYKMVVLEFTVGTVPLFSTGPKLFAGQLQLLHG